MKEFRKSLYSVALCVSFFQLIHSNVAYSIPPEELLAEDFAVVKSMQSESDKDNSDSHKDATPTDSYTINFNNVSIVEFIRFVSKIANLNFVFEEGDLQFSVTVVSEEPVSSQNVMAALAQILRVHGLMLLEQDKNVLIVKSLDVNQIPTIISGDLPDSKPDNSMLVTRVFRIKNANVNSVASIIRPLTSKTSLIEISVETRQLIVTDITTNVEKIATLLTSLDAPHTSLDIDSYIVQHISPQELIALTQQIVSPFTEGNPLTFVPQAETNSIFIVSTPYLIERALTVMEDLDKPSTPIIINPKGRIDQSAFLYKTLYRTPKELIQILMQIDKKLKSNVGATNPLTIAINEVQEIKETNSLLFVSDPETILTLTSLLTSIDVPDTSIDVPNDSLTGANSTSGSNTQFLIYSPKHLHGEKLKGLMEGILHNLKTAHLANPKLLQAIQSIQWNASSNALVFTGDPISLEEVQKMLDLVDLEYNITEETQLFIYKPLYGTHEQIEASLNHLLSELDPKNPLDTGLIRAIQTLKWDPSSNTLMFISNAGAISRLKEILPTLDNVEELELHKAGKPGFLIYGLKYASSTQLIESLKFFASTIAKDDPYLAKTLTSVRYIKETNSLLFVGPEESLQQLDPLIQKFDVLSLQSQMDDNAQRSAPVFVIYNPQHISGEDLISILCDFEYNLKSSGVSDAGLFDVINNLKWIEKTQSILISGDQNSVAKVQELVLTFDIPEKETLQPSIAAIDNTSFLVYKLQYHQGSDIQTALKQVATSLGKNPGVNLQAMMDAVNSLQWIQVTNSLLGTGPCDILAKLKGLIENLDIPLRQVFIEILVIETDLDNTQNFGLMWGGQAQYLNKAAIGTGNFPVPGATGIAPVTTFAPLISGLNATHTPKGGTIPFTNGFDLGVLGDIIMHKGQSFISLGALVNALQVDSDTTIVMNPKIVTQDNKQSTLFVGQNIPFTGAQVQTIGVNTQTTTNIEYRDIGVSLTITPMLGDNDIVSLDIVHDISEQIANTTGGQNTSLAGIQTSHTHMETNVHVPNEHFVVLSGMLHDTKIHYRTGIPCLGGLPVIGALFSENDRRNSKTNVIIFVRPHIINTYTEYKAITEHQEWLYKDQASLPVLKEEFDAGLDFVKTPENE